MKNFLSIFLLVTLASSIVSCSLFQKKILPAAKQKVAKKLTEAIVKIGECANLAEVQADVHKLLKLEGDEGVVVKAMAADSVSSGEIKSLLAAKSVVGEICRAAASLALPALLEKGVPDEWECKLSDLSSKAVELASLACGKL